MKTIVELEADVIALDEQITALREQKRAAARALEDAQLAQDAGARASALSDPEKRALMQAIQAEGIDSTETVGVPGNG